MSVLKKHKIEFEFENYPRNGVASIFDGKSFGEGRVYVKHIDRKYGGSSFKRARENIAMEITGYGTEHTDFSAKCFAVASLQEWNSPMKWLSVCYRKKKTREGEREREEKSCNLQQF